MSIRAFILIVAICMTGSTAVVAAAAPSLNEIADLMREVERQLTDMSIRRAVATQRALMKSMNELLDQARDGQRGILDQLDRMIEDAEQNDETDSSSAQSSGSPRSAQTSQSPAQTSTAPEGRDGRTALDAIRGAGDPWTARLPKRRREAIVAAWQQRFPDMWREMLEKYYAALTQIPRGEGAMLP